MSTCKQTSVYACLSALLFLGMQLPGIGNPGYMPFESFERSETEDYWIQAEAGPVSSELEGSFLLDRDAGDTDVDLEGTLNLEDDRNARARVQLQPPLTGANIRLGYYGIEYQETTELTTSITVNGTTYSASDRVDSLLRMDTYELGYNQNIISTDYISIGLMFQVNFIDFKAQLDNETTGQTVTEQGEFGIPYPGASVKVFPIKWLGVYGEARRITGSTSGIDFDSSDLDAGLQLNLNPNYDVRVGYRRFNYNAKFNETELNLTSEGPYATVAVRF